MSKDYYKIAITIFVLQLFLMAILVNKLLIVKFGVFPNQTYGSLDPVIGVVVFILSIASIFVIRNLYIGSKRAQRQKLDTMKIKHLQEQNRIYRQHRHDLYNHLTVISGLAQLGKLDKLREYLAAYLDNFNKSIITVNSGLKELDVLLYAKISEARDRRIDVSYQVSESMRCSQTKIIGVITILANALDNAIKAASKAETKQLDICIVSEPDHYLFEIGNTFSSKINLSQRLLEEGQTSKLGKSRGEGLSIIRRTVASLQGTHGYQVLDGFCRLKVEIPRRILEDAG